MNKQYLKGFDFFVPNNALFTIIKKIRAFSVPSFRFSKKAFHLQKQCAASLLI